MIKELCEYLRAKLPAEPTVVVGELPSLTSEGIAVHVPSFGPNKEYFKADNASSTMFLPVVRFFVRSANYADGIAWCEALRQTFHRYSDDWICAMFQIGTSIYLGRNPEGLFEFQVTFNTQIRSDK